MSMSRSKRLVTSNDARALGQAIAAFDSEYGRLPELGLIDQSLRMDSPAGVQFLRILLGREELGESIQNEKQISFTKFKVNKTNNEGGLVYTNGGLGPLPQGLYDAWGNPFIVFLRPNKSSGLAFSYGGKTFVLKDRLAAVASLGADGKEGTSDDVLTWEGGFASDRRALKWSLLVGGPLALGLTGWWLRSCFRRGRGKPRPKSELGVG